jgi:hypothetical protein
MGKKAEICAASILVSEAERVPETASSTYPSIIHSMDFGFTFHGHRGEGAQASLPDKFSLQLSELAPKHAMVHH